MLTPQLADLAANVTTARERVALSLGPEPGDDAAYWQELAEWADWGAWCPDTHRPLPVPDWRQV